MPLAEHERAIAQQFGFDVGAANVARDIAIAVATTWVALFVLSLLEGVAFGQRITLTFLSDHGPHVRFLLALPLLISLRPALIRRMSLAIDQAQRTVVPADGQERFRRDVAILVRLWRSRIVLVVLGVISWIGAIPAAFVQEGLRASSWLTEPPGLLPHISYAGIWNIFFAAPLVRMLILWALWKLAVWVWFLSRMARGPLIIDPLHPDGRCGLRFLSEAQAGFAPLIAALSVQFGSAVAIAIRLDQVTLQSFRYVAIAFVALSLLLTFGPLLFFAPRALQAKHRTTYLFGLWSSYASAALSSRLFGATRDEVAQQLTTPEISSVCDAASLFDRVLAARPVPLDPPSLLIVLIATVVPALLPLATLLPLGEIAEHLLKLVL